MEILLLIMNIMNKIILTIIIIMHVVVTLLIH